MCPKPIQLESTSEERFDDTEVRVEASQESPDTFVCTRIPIPQASVHSPSCSPRCSCNPECQCVSKYCYIYP